jgi:hypothetical protein
MNKIDIIIDALNGCKGLTELDNVCIAEALAAARELKALKPVMEQAKESLDLAQSLLEKSRHHDQILNAYKSLRQELAKPDPFVSFTDNEEGLCIQLECDGSYYWQNLSDFDGAKFFVNAYRGRK